VTRRLLLLGVLVVALVAAAPGAAPPLPSPQWMVEQVKTLASPPMDGRGSGTPGADLAATHVAGVFRAAGLRPAGEAGSFLQPFSVPTGLRLGSPNGLDVLAPVSRHLDLGKDFTPLALSANGAATGDVLFVGYGITAPDLGYDDYAGIDARDRIVVAITGEPASQDAASPFRRPEAYHYGERAHKLINARQHGAAAILLVPRPGGEERRLPALRGLSQPQGILAAFLASPAADALLASGGMRLGDLAKAIDGTLAPRSAPLAGVKVRLEVSLVRERGTARNVVGLLPGTDPALRDQAIVIGAHYDHLGRGGEGSLAPDANGQVHPGADDNASGTVAVMALARAFAAVGGAPRTLVFVAFSGEELGLLGSAEYVGHPAVPLDRTVLMVNLDMVGRLRDRRLYVGGVDSGSGLRALVTRLAADLPLAPELRPSPFAPSDHTSFYVAGRPVLFFFTGAHADYHRPSDTWDRINGDGLATVATLAARVIAAVASDPTPPAYAKVDVPGRGGRGGYGAYFGVVPEFGEGTTAGVKVTGVRPGSPAEKAGVRAGDVIVKFAGVDVTSLEDLTFALRGKRAGDEVQVVLVRDGREQTVRAVLGDRRQ
jgi:peptidase M28-like protein/PDZ domain-containing protein